MISELEQYHGVALARLVRDGGHTGSVKLHSRGRSTYIINDKVGLYVKYSTNRLSPWPFSFRIDHQQEVADLSEQFESTFIVLVCGSDGIACLSYIEFKRVLDDNFEATAWVKASRGPRQKYWIRGSDDRRGFKVADSEFPSKVLAASPWKGTQLTG